MVLLTTISLRQKLAGLEAQSQSCRCAEKREGTRAGMIRNDTKKGRNRC